MNRYQLISASTVAILGMVLLPAIAPAQQKSLKEQLVGTWTIVSNDNTTADGKKEQVFGPNPKGILVFDSSGQYVQIIVNPSVAKFKENNRLKGTADENAAAVHGTTATFGTWTVDEATKTITVHYVGGMFPNQAGTDAKRTVAMVNADELKITNPATAAGMKSENVWKRAK